MKKCPACRSKLAYSGTADGDEITSNIECPRCDVLFRSNSSSKASREALELVESMAKGRLIVQLRSVADIQLLRSTFEEAYVEPISYFVKLLGSAEPVWRSGIDFLAIVELMCEEAQLVGLEAQCEISS